MKKRNAIAYLFSVLMIMMVFLTACNSSNLSSGGSPPSDSSSGTSGGDSSTADSTNQEQPSSSAPAKILVAYFSRVGSSSFDNNVDVVTSASLRTGDNGLSGNTEVIADMIQKAVGGDRFQIVTVNPYPSDYDTLVDQGKKEQEENYQPALKTKVENIESYDVIFIGSPMWWGTIAPPVRTFLSENDFSGKTIIPFTTHEGSGLGRSVEDIKKLSPKANVAGLVCGAGMPIMHRIRYQTG